MYFFIVAPSTTFPIVTSSGEIDSFIVVFNPPNGVTNEYLSEMVVYTNAGDISVSLSGSGKDYHFYETFDGGIPNHWYNNSERWYIETL